MNLAMTSAPSVARLSSTTPEQRFKSSSFLPADLAPPKYNMLYQGAIAAPNPYFNYVNQIPLNNPDGSYNAFVEIPAGQRLKVEYDKGQFLLDERNKQPREVNYLPYPTNYGEFSQSLAEDGDPVDALILNGAMVPGTILPVKVLGAINMIDKGEQDAKVLAVDPSSPFYSANNLEDLQKIGPGVLEILKTWFQNYKTETPSRVQIDGVFNKEQTEALIQKAHQAWLAKQYPQRLNTVS